MFYVDERVVVDPAEREVVQHPRVVTTIYALNERKVAMLREASFSCAVPS
jgi:hypothetical protein